MGLSSNALQGHLPTLWVPAPDGAPKTAVMVDNQIDEVLVWVKDALLGLENLAVDQVLPSLLPPLRPSPASEAVTTFSKRPKPCRLTHVPLCVRNTKHTYMRHLADGAQHSGVTGRALERPRLQGVLAGACSSHKCPLTCLAHRP